MRSERSPEPIWSLRSAARALSLPGLLGVVELGAQHRHRLGAVLVLRALLLHQHDDAARHVGDADRRLGLVDVLAAGARDRMVSILRSSSLISMSTSSTSGSTATVAAEVWMRPCASVSGTRCTRCTPELELQPGERPAAADLGDDFLEAALGAFGGGKNLGGPALPRGEALVHAEQVAGEQRGLVAAGAGADFDDDVALVHRVLGQKRKPQLLDDPLALVGERAALVVGHLAHRGCRSAGSAISASRSASSAATSR